MLVYGDRAVPVAPREALRRLTAKLKAVQTGPPGPERHDQLVGAFLEGAGLAQGLADAEFDTRGFDDASPLQDAAMALIAGLARKVATSLWSGFAVAGPPVAPELLALAVQPLPAQVSIKLAEGYAFYALDPGACLKTAAEHAWPAPPLVIGLRSIGTSLAALAAVASRAADVVTLRPAGHPFRREIRASDALRARLAAHAGPFAIVDEGPGLSGSSFGAAADLLEALGVSPARIVFLPSHRGDLGPQACARHRARWASAVRPVATLDDLLAERPLSDWFEDLTGPVAHVEDLSGGAWREALGLAGCAAPPVHASQERRKFRLSTASGRWLARFAGLGAMGEAKLERARALHRADFAPEPLALRRGFLLERWETGTPGCAIDRGRLAGHLGRYLAFRAATFRAEPYEGAGAAALIEMARVNIAEGLGEAAGPLLAKLEALASDPPELRPVHVDGRLHRWEWLRTPDDRLLKTDALDHSNAHDLIGAQDIAWDVAGAEIELGLSQAEVAAVWTAIARTGLYAARSTRELTGLAYPAFQLGYWRMAGETAQAEVYARWLRAMATETG